MRKCKIYEALLKAISGTSLIIWRNRIYHLSEVERILTKDIAQVDAEGRIGKPVTIGEILNLIKKRLKYGRK